MLVFPIFEFSCWLTNHVNLLHTFVHKIDSICTQLVNLILDLHNFAQKQPLLTMICSNFGRYHISSHTIPKTLIIKSNINSGLAQSKKVKLHTITHNMPQTKIKCTQNQHYHVIHLVTKNDDPTCHTFKDMTTFWFWNSFCLHSKKNMSLSLSQKL